MLQSKVQKAQHKHGHAGGRVYNSFVNKNKAIFALVVLWGCGDASKAHETPWLQVQGCWQAVPSVQEKRERLILQVVLAEDEPDMTSFKYSILSDSERVLIAQWRLEYQQNPSHPRWSGMAERIQLLSESMICFKSDTVVFHKQGSEVILPIQILSQEQHHIQLSYEDEIWDLWVSNKDVLDFNRTGLAPIQLARVPSTP